MKNSKLKMYSDDELVGADCFYCKYIVNDYWNPKSSGGLNLQACCGIDVTWHDMGYRCPLFAAGGYYTINNMPTEDEIREAMLERYREIQSLRNKVGVK